MTSTPLEKLRQLYQDIEDKRKEAVKLLQIERKTAKVDAFVMHHVADLSQQIQEISGRILSTLESKAIERSAQPLASFNEDVELRLHYHSQVADRAMKEKQVQEKAAKESLKSMNDMVYDIQGAPHMSLFYDNDRYQEWRRLHENEKKKKKEKKSKVTVSETDPALTKFSGEECYGKYLDLTNLHSLYVNAIPNETTVTYLEFLQKIFATKDFGFVPKGAKGDEIMNELVNYLNSYITRSQPFFPLKETLESFINAFNQTPLQDSTSEKDNYCEICNRHFDTLDRFATHQNEKSHIRMIQKLSNKPGGIEGEIKLRNEKKKERERNVFIALQLITQLKVQFEATINNTIRRQTISAAVIEAENHDLDAPIVFDDNESDDEEQFFNPKGLPLGWDGKPIPIWLYKLHGLSVEYKCEICGNKSYWGQLAFERHFFEPTHVNHLRMLGIPNTKHFVNITSINDAVALFEKIKSSLSQDVWQRGEEEIELEDGTVMPSKLYDDMVRQGLIKTKQK